MNKQYQIEKWIWNQNDFEQMGWHDNPIWAMSFDDNVKFDLDYIFNWVKPENTNGSYRFWISQGTLVFKNPTKFKMEMETDFVNGLEIADIEREITNDKSAYIIEAQEGRILIETEEFKQMVRRPPTLQISQALSELERGPISFQKYQIRSTNQQKKKLREESCVTNLMNYEMKKTNFKLRMMNLILNNYIQKIESLRKEILKTK